MNELVSEKEIKKLGFKKTQQGFDRRGIEIGVVWRKGRDVYVSCSHCHKFVFCRGELQGKGSDLMEVECPWCKRRFGFK